MKRLFIFLFIFFAAANLFSQQAYNWKVYSDQKDINAIAYYNGELWAATSGGAFRYNLVTKEYTILNKQNGLLGTSITSLTVDKYGKVWFGTKEGILNVYNPETEKFTAIYEIYKSDKNPKSITELRVAGDSIVASTDFGICIIDSKTLSFLDTYFKLGTLSSNTKINSAIKNSIFFAGTSEGIAMQLPGTTNLSSPDSWTIIKAPVIPSNSIVKLDNYKNNVIAITSSGLTIFNGNNWTSFLPEINSNIEDIATSGDSLFILYQNKVVLYNGSISSLTLNASDYDKINFAAGYGLFSATSKGIFSLKENQFIYPNGPVSNQFPSLAVDNNGVLWSASGRDLTGKGFYSLADNFWTNYNISNINLSSNAVHSVFSDGDITYFGYWGNGFARLKKGVLTNFDASNTGLQGVSQNPGFIVISSFDVDSKGNLWLLNYASAANKNLSMLTTDSTWYHFSVPAESNNYIYEHFNLAIDNYDTKWYSVSEGGFTGLYYFNENKTNSTTTDDKSGFLNTTSGLNDVAIRAIVVDKRGDVWVGTPLGVNMITNTGTILNTKPSLKITSIYTLRQQSINCIAVDALNNKWVGTNQGLLVVNSDGSSLLAAYNSTNSPLLSDEIKSLSIDEKSGVIYAGSDLGLVSFNTSSLKPEQSFSELFIYPNPLVINGGDVKLTIDKLIRDTDIKIIDMSGKLVKEFSTPGGRIGYWDGKNESGNYVNSGVYIIIAFDKEGNNIATGKIAVLRK